MPYRFPVINSRTLNLVNCFAIPKGAGIYRSKRSSSVLATNPIALPDSLKKQKSTIRIGAVADPMGCARADSIACARSYHFIALKLACHNGQRALKNKIVVSALAVLMPRDYIARREREQPRLHVAAYHHGLYAFDLIIRLFGCHSRFRVHGASIPTVGTPTLRAAQLG